MSRPRALNIRKAAIFLLACLFACAAPPTYALEPLKNEIVYRTNLGRADDVTLLLQQGASANERNDAGVPLLALAAARKDNEGVSIVKALLTAGGDINIQDPQGRNALFYAAKNGNKDAALFLLRAGIDYYAADHKGTIARTVAFRNGHKDVMEAMDDFVNSQSKAVNQQYQDAYHALEERQKQPVEAAPPAPVTAPAPPPPPPPEAAEDAQAQRMEREANEKREQQAVASLFGELALNSCAFQYWSYCHGINQSTELSPDELSEAIEVYKQNIADNEKALIDAHHVKRRDVRNVSDSAKARVFNQLNTMPSKSYRHEIGIGKKSDMLTRCKDITREWSAPPPPLAGPPKNAIVPGGGIGKVPAQQNGAPGDLPANYKPVVPKDVQDKQDAGSHRKSSPPPTTNP